MKHVLAFLLVIYFPAGSSQLLSDNQKLCPVMRGKINKEIYADYENKRIFLCCRGCETRFRVKPEFYVKQMEKRGVVLRKLRKQSKCPVTGEGVTKEHFIDIREKRIRLCSKKCGDIVRKYPLRYLRIVSDNGEYPENIEKNSAGLFCIPCL